MKKILIAMDNEYIFRDITREEAYDVYAKDIVYKEGVLEYLSKNKADVLITKDFLEGDMTKEIYIKQLRLLSPNCIIILFTNTLDDNYRNFLFANDVYNIIEGEKIKISELKKYITGNNENVIYKINQFSKELNKDNIDINIITKKKISVFGTNGAGKSYICSLLARKISKELKMKTLAIDLNLQGTSMSIYNNLECNNNILYNLVEEIDNQNLTLENFDKNIYKDKLNGKISYITNNMRVFDYQNKMSKEHYKKIYDLADKKYDVVITDLSSNIFLDATYYTLINSDKIIFVINGNYISINEAIKTLDFITNVWGVDKSKITIAVNKITKNSLSISQVESILLGYKVGMEVLQDDKVESIINGIGKISDSCVKEAGEIYKLFGVENNKLKTKKKFYLLGAKKKNDN